VFGEAILAPAQSGGRLGLADLVERITLSRGGQSVTLERQPSGQAQAWLITAPLRRAASRQAVDRLLYGLEFLKRVPAAPPAGDAGLQPPRAEVAFTAAGREWRLRVGAAAPGHDTVYVQRGDSPGVVAADAAGVAPLFEDFARLRDDAVLRAHRFDVTRVEWRQAGKPAIVAERHGAMWRLAQPEASLAHAAAVDSVVRALCGQNEPGGLAVSLNPDSLVSDDEASLAGFGLEPPARSVALTVRGEQRGLRAGPPKDGKACASRLGESSAYLLPDKDLAPLFPGLDSLRCPTALEFSPEAIQRIEIAQSGAAVVLERVEGRWRLEQPEAAEADGEEVERFLAGLRQAPVSAWPSQTAPALGLDKPSVTVSLFEKSATHRLSLALAQDACYALRGGETQPLRLDASVRELAAWGCLGFLPKTVLRFAKDHAQRVEIAGPERRVVVERDGAAWRMTAPAKAEASASAVNELLWDLGDLRAREVAAIGPPSLKPFGLDPPAWRVRVTVQPPQAEAQTHELLLSAGQGDSLCAALAGKDRVYRLDRGVESRLAAEMASLRVAALAPDGVEALEVEREGRPAARFERSGQTWKQAGAEEPPPQRYVLGLVDAMSGLTALSIATYAPLSPEPFGLDKPRLRLAARVKGGATVELRVGRERHDGVYASGGATPFVYVISRNDAARLLAPPDQP